jgi:pyruvate dehydrogenase E2 component (dihydrolipoamide acetyltransferase)
MDVKLPKLGEGADSGVVVSILVKEGDPVSEGQTLMELENEKAVAPIPSPAAGVVGRIRVREGDKVSAGQVILILSGDGKAAPASAVREESPAPRGAKSTKKAKPAEPEPAARAEAEPVPEFPRKAAEEVAASPNVRRLARELGLDLTRVQGTERGGRVGMGDVRDYVQRLQKIVFGAKATPGKGSPLPPEPIDFSKWGEISRKPLSQLRQVIARRMTENWTTIPHVTQFDDADLTAIMDLRRKHQPAYEGKGVRLTLTPFVIKAVVHTLRKHPIFNSSLDEAAGELVFKEYFHIGVAVDTEAGLIVPVVRNADQKSLFELAREVEELAARARDRKISLDELKGGTFTISNQGGIGGAHFTPIINKPEVAILGLGRGAFKAVAAAREKKVETRLMVPLALSYDHRVIDGGAAARFMVDLVQAFEQFSEAEVRG